MKNTPPDHIGWDLVRAARWWQAAFIEEVVASGHPWFGEARGRMAEHIARDGTDQAAIVRRSGLTKQAVAVHLDALEADGLVKRTTDADDSRRRRVEWSEEGREALKAIDAAKLRVERRVRDRIGADRIDGLRAALKAMAPDSQIN